MVSLLAAGLTVLGTITGAFGSLYLKKGAEDFNLNILEQIRNKSLITGISLFVLGTLLYVYALSLERLSLLYPLTSLSYIWIALISEKFLGERMNKHKWLGILLIILGIFLVTFLSGS